MEDLPEVGRPAAEVLERAAREILPFTARNDHPRFFGELYITVDSVANPA